ncbi:MAG: aminopeptidase P family protein, partial [Chitinophagaceae bacterium]
MSISNASQFYSARLNRLHQLTKKRNVDFCILTSPPTLTYYSAHFFYFEHGPSPFQVIPAVLIASKENESALLVADNEQVPESTAVELKIHTYQSYVYRHPLQVADSFVAGMKDIIGKARSTKIRIGIESSACPAIIAHTLTDNLGNIEWVDVSNEIRAERMIKDELEIEMITRAAALCDIGQRVLQTNIKVGQSELELFSIVSRAINEGAGTRVPVMADFVSGPRTATGGGIPSGKVTSAGDLLLCDLTPCLNGYWGDCCGTVAAGTASTSQRRDFETVRDGLSRAIDTIKPGIKASQLDEFLRKHVSDYPHHSGHGVGTMNHEEPRITPYNEMELQAGMV